MAVVSIIISICSISYSNNNKGFLEHFFLKPALVFPSSCRAAVVGADSQLFRLMSAQQLRRPSSVRRCERAEQSRCQQREASPRCSQWCRMRMEGKARGWARRASAVQTWCNELRAARGIFSADATTDIKWCNGFRCIHNGNHRPWLKLTVAVIPYLHTPHANLCFFSASLSGEIMPLWSRFKKKNQMD